MTLRLTLLLVLSLALFGCQSQFQNVPAPKEPAKPIAEMPVPTVAKELAIVLPNGCVVLTNRWGRVVTNCPPPPVEILTVYWPAWDEYGLGRLTTFPPVMCLFLGSKDMQHWQLIGSNRIGKLTVRNTNNYAYFRAGATIK